MKLSDAILKGMERFPEQAVGRYRRGKNAACAMGCAYWVSGGEDFSHAQEEKKFHRARVAFIKEYGCQIVEANDGGLLREEIVGMLQAIGE